MPTTTDKTPETTPATASQRRPTAPAARGGAREDLRESVRGMGYEEGARRLSPGAGPAGATGSESTPAPANPNAPSAPAEEGPILSPQAYEAALGRLLGGKLYEVVVGQTSADKMAGHAKKVVDAIVKAGGGLAKDDATLDDAGRKAVTDALQNELGPALKAEAEAYLASEEGRKLAAGIQGWTTEPPWAIVAAALLAAAGAVAANVEVPRLGAEKSVTLGQGEGAAKITAGAGVRLGRIRELTLQAIDARIALEAGRFTAEAKVEHKKDGGTTGEVSAKYGTDAASVSTVAKLDRQGVVSASAGAKIKTEHGEAALSAGKERDKPGAVDATVAWGDGQERKLAGAARVDQAGGWAVNLSQEITKDAWTRSDSYALSDKGGTSTTSSRTGDDRNYLLGGVTTTGAGQSGFMEGRHTEGNLSAGGRVEGGGVEGPLAKGDVKWDTRDLTATLNARFGRGQDAVGGDVQKRLGNYTLGASAEYGLIDRKFLSVGARFGYSDPEKFEAFLLEYKRSHAGDVTMDEFKVTVEHTLGQYLLRAENQTTLKDGRLSSGTGSLMAARPLNEDWKVIGGLSAGYGPDKSVGVRPEVGVQYKNIAVTVGYDLNNKATGIRLTIPFGR
jgi:hypothetical protein